MHEYNKLMVKNIEAINEARTGTIRRTYDLSYDSEGMSSVGSFGSDSSDLNTQNKAKTEKDSDPDTSSHNASSILEKEEYRKL
jgi:hypothetical protein